jgi:hypothetical protein
METIFKKGDKVFCLQLGGWGEVIKEENPELTPFTIRCSFPIGKASFTWDGRFYEEAPSTLSFTEYTLEGFNQERPEELPKKGDVVWVRDNNDEAWQVSIFLKKQGIFYLCTRYDPEIESYVQCWDQLTTKNPYKNEQ